MKRTLLAVALALATFAAGYVAWPAGSPAFAEADPFDNARYYITSKQNAEALAIIDSGAFPIDQGNYEGWTMLHYAAESGNLEMVRALLERGADPTSKTKYGSLPYEVASATMVKAAIAAAVEARTGRNPMKPAQSAAAPPARAITNTATAANAGSTAKSPREKMCQERWYSSQTLCSDSTCKMREYRKWQTCLKTGSYY